MNTRHLTSARCNVRSLAGLSVHTTRRPISPIFWQGLALAVAAAAAGVVTILVIVRL